MERLLKKSGMHLEIRFKTQTKNQVSSRFPQVVATSLCVVKVSQTDMLLNTMDQEADKVARTRRISIRGGKIRHLAFEQFSVCQWAR